MLGSLRLPREHLTHNFCRNISRALHATAGAARSAHASDPPPSPTPPSRVRSYPSEPRVGVGVVVLRQLTQHKRDAEVLLVRRGKPPSKGEGAACSARPPLPPSPRPHLPRRTPLDWQLPRPQHCPFPAAECCHRPTPLLYTAGLWCFPGGSLELGETLADCAVRETQEETGVVLRCGGGWILCRGGKGVGECIGMQEDGGAGSGVGKVPTPGTCASVQEQEAWP